MSRDIEFSGTLIIDKGASGSLGRIGGIAGDSSQSDFADCRFTGNLQIDRIDSTGASSIGGVFGYFGGTADGHQGRRVVDNCWASGSISIDKNTSGGLFVGGVVANNQYLNGVNFSNCRFEDGNITISGSATDIVVGGFVTSTQHTTNFSNCYTLAGTIKVTSSSYMVRAGGFIGIISGSAITGAYAKTNVIVEGTSSNVYAGGFSGAFEGAYSAFLSRSYATGNVTIQSDNPDANLIAGGLLGGYNGSGGGNHNIQFENCYALGLVRAEQTNPASTGRIVAAGIAGSISVGSVNGNFHSGISYSFFGGTLTAISAGECEVLAGGILGFSSPLPSRNNNAYWLRNNAVIGASISALGGDSPVARRILGNIDIHPNRGFNTNHALAVMRIEEDEDHEAAIPKVRTAVSDALGQDGQNATFLDHFMVQRFWIETLRFNLTAANSPVNNWNFSSLEGKGHPALSGLGGQ
jgi:hypothetical protein